MVLFLNEKDVRDLLPMGECIDVLEEAFANAGRGLADNKPRSRIRMPNGFLHFMAAASLGPGTSAFGYKAYATFPGGPTRFLVSLYNGETGELLCIMEASALGQVRTGAASGLATRHMARPDASTVAVIGTGYQARTQLEAVCAVRDVKAVRAFSRTEENRRKFATLMTERLNVEVVPVDSAEECVQGADVAIAITSSREPVLKGEWLKEGAHVNAAGGNHWMRREVDPAAVQRSSLIVVDDLEQARVECGDLIWAAERGTFRWSMVHELKDVVSGRMAGRPGDDSITLFESQGVALEDVAAGLHVYRKAKEQGIGQELPF